MKRALLILAATGCAPALSSFQPAHVAAKGTVGVELGADISIPTSTVGKVIDAAKALSSAAQDRELTDDERDQVFEAGVALALAPPAAVPHIGVAYAPADDWEIALRYASGGVRLGLRRQLLHQDRDAIDLTVGFGVSRFAYEFPVGDLVDVLQLDDFTRYSAEPTLVIGQHHALFRWWAGPRLAFDSYRTSLRFTQPTSRDVTLASIDGNSVFAGAQLGLGVGFRRLFVAAELTVVKLYSTANASIAGSTRGYDLDGTVIYPGFALTGDF